MSMRQGCSGCVICLACWGIFAALLPAADWTEFRGPTGQGHAHVKGLPLSWDKTTNVVWRREVPGKGWSSPIILGDALYLTAAVPESDASDAGQSLQAICLDMASGEQRWVRELFTQPKSQKIHSKNSHASATPITDGELLYVHFGTHGTAALDLTGAVLWRMNDLKYTPVHGNGGSPVLAGDHLIMSCDGADTQFIVALDRSTGKLRWKTPRSVKPVKGFAFGTPLVIDVAGTQQVVSTGPDAVYAYDPQTGDELWKVRYPGGYSVVPRPVFGNGLLYVSSGYDSPRLLAIRTDGRGDVTDTHIAWELKRGAPHNPSPLLVDKELYLIADNGVASCLDAATGTQHWQERIGGNYSSSPLYAEGRIYLQSEEGVGVVLRAGTTFEELSRNDLGERTLASYAVGNDGSLFIRTEKALLKIAAAKP